MFSPFLAAPTSNFCARLPRTLRFLSLTGFLYRTPPPPLHSQSPLPPPHPLLFLLFIPFFVGLFYCSRALRQGASCSCINAVCPAPTRLVLSPAARPPVNSQFYLPRSLSPLQLRSPVSQKLPLLVSAFSWGSLTPSPPTLSRRASPLLVLYDELLSLPCELAGKA